MIEKNLEQKEREDRRKNVLIKGMEVREGRRREAVEGILEKIGAKVKVGGKRGEEGEMVVVRLENEEQRREVMRKKVNLKDRNERICEDWTWRERKMKWKLEEIANEEVRKGMRV